MTLWGMIDAQAITFPVRIDGLNHARALYPVDADAARPLLPACGFDLIETTPGVAHLILLALDVHRCPWGPFQEMAVGFYVQPTEASGAPAGALFCTQPTTQRLSCEVGHRAMGLPTSVAEIGVRYEPAAVTFTLTADGEPALSLRVPRVPARLPPIASEAVLYSTIDGRPYRTDLVFEEPADVDSDPADVRLDLGTGPLADSLRDLALPPAPDMCTWGEDLSLTLQLATPL
ncbi:MAG TPA: hypothetical protein VF743_02255 [Acidimicrobiales bacterium]